VHQKAIPLFYRNHQIGEHRLRFCRRIKGC
jgi:hypothetical protein